MDLMNFKLIATLLFYSVYMTDIKESLISKLLDNKIVKFVILPVLGIMLVYASLNHIYRCHKNLNSRFLWGLDECQECKVQPVKIDTIIKDTCIGNKIDTFDKRKSDVYHTNIKKADRVDIGPHN